MRKTVIGVMGPGEAATRKDIDNAFELGKLIAGQDWILLSGGRNKGVMAAANQGAKSVGGLTIGIIPTADNLGTSDGVDISIITDMGSARNNINVLSSAVVIACGMGPGTASEIALALKAKKEVILLNDSPTSKAFFKEIGGQSVHSVGSPVEAIEKCQYLLKC
jgi:uncharacterized protein (TIGR00725 family)